MSRQYSNVSNVGRALNEFEALTAGNQAVAAGSLTALRAASPTDPFSVDGISFPTTTADSFNAASSSFIWRQKEFNGPNGEIINSVWFLTTPEIATHLDVGGFFGNYHPYIKVGDQINAHAGWGSSRAIGAFAVTTVRSYGEGNFTGLIQYGSTNPGSGDFVTIIPESSDPVQFAFADGGSYTVTIGGNSDGSYTNLAGAVNSAAAAGDLPEGFGAVNTESSNKFAITSSGGGTAVLSTNIPRNEFSTMYNVDRNGFVNLTNLTDFSAFDAD